MTAAHAGYPAEQVPVGGAGAICERLCRAWSERSDVRLTLLGPGPSPPQGLEYVRLPLLERPPCELTAWEYARFCRAFETACTEYVLGLPGPCVVVAHDISEGPDFARLAARGVPLCLLVHVDVVEYFARIYMGGWFSAPRLATLARGVRPSGLLPDVLRLVFDKQQDAVVHARQVVVPAPGMASMLAACYPGQTLGKVQVQGWGGQEVHHDPDALEEERARLRRVWGLGENDKVLMTLSRISPEKGHDTLLDALRIAEGWGWPEATRLVVCGAPAYMQGARFARRLRRKASALKTPVIFAGHLGGLTKAAALSLATVFVTASHHESYGLTTLEAMQAGLPVVGVRTHGSEATADDRCAILIDAGSDLPGRLARALHSLLGSPRELERLSLGARVRAQGLRFADTAEALLLRLKALRS